MEDLKEQMRRIERLILLGTKNVLTTEEAAMLMGVSADRIRHMCQKHMIPYHKQEGVNRIYFRKDELEACMTARRFPTDAEIRENPDMYLAQMQG